MRFPFSFVRALAGLLLCGAVLALTGCDSSGANQDQTPQDENQPPTAEASVSSTTVDVGKQVTLDGSGSSDPDGDDLTFSWSLDVPSGSNASLSDASAEQPTFTPDVEGDYTATLEVSDGDATDSDDATATAQSLTTEISSNITSDRTLTSDTTYVVTTTVDVRNQSTLTIEPGTQVRFSSNEGLKIVSGSALVAEGTSDDPITMTATAGNEQQGWWKGVAIFSNNANNAFDYVEIRHAGSGTIGTSIDEAANIALDNAQLTLSNSTVTDGGGYGLYIQGSQGAGSLEGFSANSFADNANGPLWIPFESIGAMDANSSFADGTSVRIYGARLNSDATVTALSGDTPYRFTSGFNRPEVGDATLTINPGVEMTFESDVGFGVLSGSALVAEGTSDDPITMTATAGNEQQGWWKGVAIFSNNANNTLDHVEIRHAGSGTVGTSIDEAANIGLDGDTQLTLNNATITDSGNHGVYCQASSSALSASGNSYNNNAGQDVANCQ